MGAFLGLRCLTRARAYTGRTRAIWLLLASVAIGATGIWVMHFVAMLGFAIPGQQILYNVPITGMHYTGMAAMHVYAGGGTMSMSGYPADSFLFPLLLSASVLTFLLSLTIAMCPTRPRSSPTPP